MRHQNQPLRTIEAQPAASIAVTDRSPGLPPLVEGGTRYFARRTFNYTDEIALDRGQILTLGGHPNDEKLVRLGYVKELSPCDTYACSECGAEFVGIGERTGHGRERHADLDLTPGEVDERIERREEREQAVAPLYLEKTLAAQK